MSAEPRLTELLMQWEELRQQGQTVALEELCSDSPELLDELQRRIRALQAMDSVLAVTSSVVDGATVTSGIPADERAPWPSVPGYEVLGVLGYGGMGVVYKVRNLKFDRVEALKMIRARLGAHPLALQRFQMEIRAMAQFEDARIVRIYDAGEHEGQPYFTMEYVGSGNLAEHMRQTAVTPEAAVALTIKVAKAVHYLHTRNVIHRDLKPANILLKKELDDPLVSDFGLAKLFDRDIKHVGEDPPGAGPRLTQAGSVMGTAAYMSPEQAAGETDQLTAATDVWAIGVILYELLTGHRPFQGKDSASVREAVKTVQPPALRHYRPRLDRHLEAICLRCLAKDPGRRYATAQALSDDLERWQQGNPILPERLLRRIQRRALRYPTAVFTLLCLTLLMVFAGVIWTTRTEPIDREAAAEQRLAAVAAVVATGKPVTLIPDRGPPPAYRWVTRGVHETASSDPDKPFAVHADAYSLLELVPAHGLAAYRLRIQVHHDAGEPSGIVGVYFGYSKQSTADGRPVHYFCGADFNDIAVIPGRPIERGNELNLSLHLLYPKQPGAVVDAVHRQPAGIKTTFRTAGLPREDVWRTLQIDVGPEEVRITWDQDGKPLRPARRADWKFYAALLVAGSPALPQEQPQFLPQEGLGLYLFRASAWFRSCTIEALPGQ